MPYARHTQRKYLSESRREKKKLIFSLFKMAIETLSPGERGGTLPVILSSRKCGVILTLLFFMEILI